MNFSQSPKRHRYCEQVTNDTALALIQSQATGCYDLKGVEVYEFDVLAVYCSWLNGILIAPVLWLDESAGFDLDTDKAEVFNQPKPDFIATELLPLMTQRGFVVGTAFEPDEVIKNRVQNLFKITTLDLS